MGEMSILDLKKKERSYKKGPRRTCVYVIFYSGAEGLGWPTKQWSTSQGSPLQLSEGDAGIKDKHKFKGNQEKYISGMQTTLWLLTSNLTCFTLGGE